MSNVIEFPGYTTLDIPAERVLDAAKNAELDTVIIVGYTKEGDEYFASSIASGPETLWLLERSKHRLLKICDRDD